MRSSHCRAILVALAFSLNFQLAPAQAALLELSPDNPPNSSSVSPYTAVQDNADLNDVVTLLKRGERKEAKLQ